MNKSDNLNISSNVNKEVIAAFDFDCTITSKDTFLPYLIRAFGRFKVYTAFFSLAFPAILVLLKISNRDEFKELILKKLFTNVPIEYLDDIGKLHSEEIIKWCMPSALERVKWHSSQGHRLVLVSASLNLYLEHVYQKIGFNDLLCSEVEVINNKTTGSLIGKNCRAKNKVVRLENLLGNIDEYELYAYGDSAGDKQMLEIADHSFYRFFN